MTVIPEMPAIPTVISYNFYYARPGNADAVLDQRLRASDVRVNLGLSRGRTTSKIQGAEDFADVIWRLDFADMSGQNADMSARAESPAFEAIRHGMRKLYRRFERPLYAPCHHGSSRLLSVAPEQLLQLYGIYCEASVNAAVHEIITPFAVSHGLRAAALISGGENIPRIICEIGDAVIPQQAMAELQRLPVRIEHSVWQTKDSDQATDPAVK